MWILFILLYIFLGVFSGMFIFQYLGYKIGEDNIDYMDEFEPALVIFGGTFFPIVLPIIIIYSLTKKLFIYYNKNKKK